MERLTFYQTYDDGDRAACFRLGTTVYADNNVAAKLAAYEDTLLTPDEVVALKAERDALLAEKEFGKMDYDELHEHFVRKKLEEGNIIYAAGIAEQTELSHSEYCDYLKKKTNIDVDEI